MVLKDSFVTDFMSLNEEDKATVRVVVLSGLQSKLGVVMSA
jgi:hypothetical protein